MSSANLCRSPRFELFAQVALDIMREQVDQSRPTKDFVLAHTKARLIGTYGAGVAPIPGKTRAYEILSELDTVCPLFTLSTKRNRDIAGRPVMPYGKLHPARPGEYLLMDTTPLDVFALDPHTLRWVGVQLTVAMDWYSRCITGLRLTPVSTRAIDAAALTKTTGATRCIKVAIGMIRIAGSASARRDSASSRSDTRSWWGENRS